MWCGVVMLFFVVVWLCGVWWCGGVHFCTPRQEMVNRQQYCLSIVDGKK